MLWRRRDVDHGQAQATPAVVTMDLSPSRLPAQALFRPWPLILIVWVAAIASFLISSLNTGVVFSTDDAMRLVQVRDLLAGQDWFDTTQHRMNPPAGLPMHWSRLIDLPLAALIKAGTSFFPAARAELIAAWVWPCGLLLVFLFGIARLARELAGPFAAQLAIIFAALSFPMLQYFRAGGIDHHNAQLALLVWALAFAVRPEARAAAIAGVCCALAIAIGQENTPAIAAIAASVAMRWIIDGSAVKAATIAFALPFAAATLLSFAATVAPSAYGTASCDSLSIVHLMAAIVGGGGLAVLAGQSILNSIGRRLAGAIALGALTAAMLALAFPECLSDPYLHVDPRLATLWLNNVSEAQSILTMLRNQPQEVPLYYGLIVAGLVLGLYRAFRESESARWAWIACIVVLVPLTAMAFWQVRSSSAGNAIAVALVPAALVRGFSVPDKHAVFLGLGRAALIAAALLNPPVLFGMGVLTVRAVDAARGQERPATTKADSSMCMDAAAYAPLDRLPRGLVAAVIDAGPFLLMATPHSALAAPYHRSVEGNAAMYDIFLSPPAEAARHLMDRGVAYVALCPASPELKIYAAAAPQGLAAALGRGEVPAFLEPTALEGANLVAYRVRLESRL